MRGLLSTVVVAALAVLAPPAAAQVEPTGYDGTNPFDCVLQQAGTTADFPDPGADPFCVEYDKTHQNVTQLGVVQFLSLEPARVAAAGPKCFYFQRDHWTGTVLPDDPATETYHWDGSYYYDKARGVGGVFVENFRLGQQTGDPTTLPGFPEEYKPFFGPGRGGVQTVGNVPVDPNCVAAAQRDDPRRGPGGGAGRPEEQRCRVPGGQVERGIGGIKLGMKRSKVGRALGPASTESRRFVGWCMTGGGRLLAGFSGAGDSGRVLLVYTDAPPFDAAGIRVGSGRGKAVRRLRGETTLARSKGLRVLSVMERGRRLLVGVTRKRVAFLAVASPAARAASVRRYLRQVP